MKHVCSFIVAHGFADVDKDGLDFIDTAEVVLDVHGKDGSGKVVFGWWGVLIFGHCDDLYEMSVDLEMSWGKCGR